MVTNGIGNGNCLLPSSSPFVDEFCCGESDDSYEIENDDDDDEENEESVDFPQTSFSSTVNKNNRPKFGFLDTGRKSATENLKFKSNNVRQPTKPMKWTTSSPQVIFYVYCSI